MEGMWAEVLCIYTGGERSYEGFRPLMSDEERAPHSERAMHMSRVAL